MHNIEQMIHVAERCLRYEKAAGRMGCGGGNKLCKTCMHCENSTCLKDMFECTLMGID